VTDRTVKVGLVAETASFDGPILASSKIVGDFGASNQAAAAAAKTASAEAVAGAQAISAAAKEAANASRDAAATSTAANQAVTASQKEASAAAKEAAAAETASAKAVTDEEIASAAAAKEAAAQRVAAAEAGVASAQKDAASAAEAAASAKEFAASQRDVAAAAKAAADASKASATILADVAAQEATAAKASVDAAAEREAAYKKAGTAITTMAAGFGLAAGVMVKSAGDFQSSTQHLVTDAGESQGQLAMVQAGILKTATDTGTSATALVDAMYHIESAGFHGKTGLDMLTVAAEGAKVGNADLGVVAKTLTGTMNSYSTAGYSSTQMMNMMIATTAAGDMKMNDLAGSLGNVTAVAASAKITFPEVAGAIATMTSQNMSADRATQDLSHTISSLQNPTNVQIQQMQQLGLSSNDVSSQLGTRGLTGTLELLTNAVAAHTQNGQVFIDTLKSSSNAAADMKTMLAQLPPSIQDISKQLMNGTITTADYNKGISGLDASNLHLAKQFEGLAKTSGSFNDLLKSGKPDAESFNASMSNLLGGTTGLNTALMLTGGRMQTFKDSAASVADAANKGGGAVSDWDKIQGTFNQKMDVAKASIGAAGIAIGTTLLPVVSELAKWISDIVQPIAEWVDKHQALTAVVLGSVAAVSALVVLIAAAVKTCALIKTAVEGVSTAIGFFRTSSAEAAASAEAMGAANAKAAAETEGAAASTAGFASKLGGAIPIIGGVIAGAAALGTWLGHLGKSEGDVAAQTTTMANALLDVAAGSQAATTQLGKLASAGVQVGGKMGDQIIAPIDKQLAELVSSGHADQAKAALDGINAALVANGISADKLAPKLKQYNDALGSQALNQRLATTGTDANSTAADANAVATDATASATKALTDATGTATDATSTLTDAQKAQAAGTQQLAAIASANTGGVLAYMMATLAANDAVDAGGTVTKGATSATSASTSVKGAATSATNAQTAAEKAAAKAGTDTAKAVTDQGKASALNAAATKAATDATNTDASATATAAEKKKANSAATSAAAAATRANTTAVNADGTAANASSTATDKATKATDAKAKATQASQTASEKEADAQKAAADAAANAAFEHDIGTTALKAWAAAAFDTQHATDKLDDSVAAEVAAMKDAKNKSNDLKDALDALNGVHIAAGKAALDVQQKIADLTKAMQDNGKTLDITTDKGRLNMTQVYDTAAAINAHAQAVTDESGSVYQGIQALQASRDEFDKVLVHAGLSKDAIQKFNDTILQTPKLATVTIAADNTAALKAVKAVYDAAGVEMYINIKGGVKAMASGGLVSGPGSETSDSVPTMLSRNEFVVNAAATRAIGVGNLTKWNAAHGGAVASVVKPQFVTQVGGTTPQPSAGAAGTALHIDHYYEQGASAQQTAAELGWYLRARGGAS
jgi:TP901 family phage tail tape measure protein